MPKQDKIKAELNDLTEYIDEAIEQEIHLEYKCMKEFIRDASRVWYDSHEDREEII